MVGIRSLVKNASALMVGEAVSKLALFFITIMAARALGVEQFGTFSFAMAYALAFLFIVNVGADHLIIRNLARDKSLASRYWTNFTLIKCLSSIGTLVVAAGVLYFLGYKDTLAVYLALIFMIIQSFRDFHFAFLRAYERMGYEALLSGVGNIVLLILAYGLLYTGYGVTSLLGAYVVVVVLQYLATLYLIHTIVRPDFEISTKLWPSLLSQSWPFLSLILIHILYVKIDIIMLSFLQGEYAVGIYSAAIAIVNGALLIPTIITRAMFPYMSRLGKDPMYTKFLQQSFKYLHTLLLPIVSGGVVLAPFILQAAYGQEYGQTLSVFRILVVFLFFMGCLQFFHIVLYAHNREHFVNKIMIGATIVNVVLNALLIPVYSFTGAAIATLVTNIVVFTVELFIIAQYKLQYRSIVKPLVAATVMGVILSYLPSMNVGILIILGIAIYSALLFLTMHFTKSDRQLFLSLKNR